MSFKKNIKGFTLFTALVGLIVIGMGILIIQHMDNSENSYSRIIISLQTQNEMQSIKDFLRYSSFNIFSLLLRAKFFTYFDSNMTNNSPIQINSNLLESDKNYISESVFFKNNSGEAFSNYITSNMVGQLYNFQGSIRNIYFFRLYDPYYFESDSSQVNSVNDTTKTLSITSSKLSSAITESISTVHNNKDENLVTFVDCQNPNKSKDLPKNCSFFVNLDMSKISDENYYYIPRIYIFNQNNFVSLDDGIIPRNNIPIYLPFRIPKTMYFATKQIEAQQQHINKDIYEGGWKKNDFSYKNPTCPKNLLLQQGQKPRPESHPVRKPG